MIVIELRPPLHQYYRVLHEGGFVPIRFADGLHRAPPGLEAALAGDRGVSAPAIELRPFTDQEIKEMPDSEWESLASSDNRRAQFPFVIANHGLGRLKDFRLGIVTSYNECKQSEYRIFVGPRQTQEFNPAALPRPLRGFLDVSRPLVRLLSFGKDLMPSSEIEIVLGVEVEDLFALRSTHLAVWVSGEGIESVFGAWKIYKVGGSI